MAKAKNCCGTFSLETGAFFVGALTIIGCLTFLAWKSTSYVLGCESVARSFREFCVRNPFCSKTEMMMCGNSANESDLCCRKICHSMTGKEFVISDWTIYSLELYVILMCLWKLIASVLLIHDVNNKTPRFIEYFVEVDIMVISISLVVAITFEITTKSPVFTVMFVIWMLLFCPIEVYIVVVLKSLKNKFKALQKGSSSL